MQGDLGICRDCQGQQHRGKQIRRQILASDLRLCGSPLQIVTDSLELTKNSLLQLHRCHWLKLAECLSESCKQACVFGWPFCKSRLMKLVL